jgi:hypothetical protein
MPDDGSNVSAQPWKIKAKCCNSEGYFRLSWRKTDGVNTFGDDILNSSNGDR